MRTTVNHYFPKQRGWQLILSNLGIEIDSFLPRANLPNDWFSDPCQNCTSEEYFQFWLALRAQVHPHDAALTLAQSFRIEEVDFPLAGAIYQSNSISALNYLQAIYPIAAPFELLLSHGGELTSVTLVESTELTMIAAPLRSLLVHYHQMLIVQLLRCATRSQLCPKLVTSPYTDNSNQANHEAFFGSYIQCDAKNRIVFDSAKLHQPLMTFNQAYINTYQTLLENHNQRNRRH